MTALLAGLAWLSALYRRPRLNRRELSAWALPGTLGALALGLTLKLPAVYEAVDDVTGRANLGQLLKDSAVVLSAFGTQVVLLQLLHPAAAAQERARGRALATVATVAAMSVAFLAARPAAGGSALHVHLADPGLVEFRGLYLIFLAWAFCDIARLCRRFARLAGDGLLTAGLRLIAAGGVVGLGYVAFGALQVLAAGRGDVLLVQRTQRCSDALIGLATLLVVLGSVLPSLPTRWSRRRAAAAAGAASAAPPELQALWTDVTRAFPEFVLPATARATLSPQEQLYRQVIEVEDARLALRSVRDRALERAAAQAADRRGIDSAQRGAAVEGAALSLALERLRSSNPMLVKWTAGPAGTSVSRQPAVPPAAPAGGLDAEVSWLSSVGRWYTDPVLIGTARQLLAGSTTSQAHL